MTYRTISTAVATLYATLAFVLLLSPGLVNWLFAVPGHATGDFMAKRAAMLFLGLAAIAFLSRDAAPSTARDAIAKGIAVAMIGLALASLYEFARGFAGPGICLAIVIEIVVSMAFFSTLRYEA